MNSEEKEIHVTLEATLDVRQQEGVVGKEFLAVSCKHLARKGTLRWGREEVYFQYGEHILRSSRNQNLWFDNG